MPERLYRKNYQKVRQHLTNPQSICKISLVTSYCLIDEKYMKTAYVFGNHGAIPCTVYPCCNR